MLIKILKSTSEWLGIYNNIRYSRLYYWVLKYKNPNYIQSLNEDLAFYRRALSDSLRLVFDVGANIGDKTWVFKQIATSVVCVEPDKSCFAVLRTRYSRDKSIRLENVALGDQIGEATFFMEEEGSCYSTLSEKQKNWLLSNHRLAQFQEVKVATSTLDGLIAKYGTPDFLKIDVEGYELPVFNGLSHFIPVISFEANLPRFREETFRILERFRERESTRYNLMQRHDFLFPSHQRYDRVIDVLNRDEVITYDVFVYNRASIRHISKLTSRGTRRRFYGVHATPCKVTSALHG